MQGTPPNVDFLQKIPFFSSFSEDALKKILSAAGEVNITKEMPNRLEKTVAVLGRKSVIGEMSLLLLNKEAPDIPRDDELNLLESISVQLSHAINRRRKRARTK